MLEIQKFPKDMSTFEVDRSDPRRLFFSGLFEEQVDVGGMSRKFYTYLKPGLHYNQPCVIVAAPDGVSGPAYLWESQWLSFAEEQDVYLFLAVPEDGSWKLDGSDADYFNRVFIQTNARRYYVTMQDNYYAIGVGAGATVAQQAVMKMSTEWSGLATFGDLEEELFAGSKSAGVAVNSSDSELFIAPASVQVPVWMAWSRNEGANAAAAHYWKTVNDADPEAFSNSWADEIYFPSTVVKTSQTNEEKIAQVRITNGFSGEVGKDRWNAVWEFLSQACRHRGFGSKQLRRRIDPVAYGFTYHTMEQDGFTRCWYEYVPERVRMCREQVPVVVCMHGRGGTAASFVSLSGMSRVAEERGFIALFPEAGVYQQRPEGIRNLLLWNGGYKGVQTDDTAFILRMLEDVSGRNAVDRSRIYACGQSSGGMMCNTLAIRAPQVFAAIAPWSALVNPSEPPELPTEISPAVPYLFLFGDNDKICSDIENGKLEYKVSQQIADVLQNLMQVYRLNPEPDRCSTGRIDYYVYRNEKHTPMLIVGRVKDMPHANFPEESWISYDSFLSKFSRREDGTLLYMGVPAL